MSKMVKANTIRPGDCISSEASEFAYVDGTSEIVRIGLIEPLLLPNRSVEVVEEEQVAVYPVPDYHFDRSNCNRPSYIYVVLSVSLCWRNIEWADTFPDNKHCRPGEGVCVEALIIDDEGDCIPNGEKILWWMSGNFPDVIDAVELHQHVELEPFLEKGRKKYEEEERWKNYKPLF
jgi:hypothetical protein